jgi:hypothetical protein
MASLSEIKKGFFRYQEVKGGVIAIVNDAASLLKALEKVRDAGVKNFDCFSPFPIHGMEEAMGVGRSWVPTVSLIGGLTGTTTAFSWLTLVENWDWPHIIGGKPFFAWPAYVPIMFELTILFAAFSTVGTVIYLGRLGKSSRRPPVNSVTSTGFAVWIADSMSVQDVQNLLGGLATDVRELPSQN